MLPCPSKLRTCIVHRIALYKVYPFLKVFAHIPLEYHSERLDDTSQR